MAQSKCRHHDLRAFDDFKCCLSCGESVSDSTYHYRRFSYQRRHEIRLLVLHGGQQSDQLTCDIIHVDLADKPPAYEALSYTWATTSGDASLSEVILREERQSRLPRIAKLPFAASEDLASAEGFG